ncbi:MAG: DUF4347 domain-containing protein [Scytonematopsis contorta HA4267-MV1]|jgi:uncharacterized delta-60 repeat protein|nr:DUF4347 domain-containing protein [Scytonematopsis contorta HA4267-MV1]
MKLLLKKNTNSLIDPDEENKITPKKLNKKSNIVFIDANIQEYTSLVSAIHPDTEVVIIDPKRDAIAQITENLKDGKYQSVHIVSHGSSGSLRLGANNLNYQNLKDYASYLQQWKTALTEDADILLYGCDIAKGEIGVNFVQNLSQLTGADVAASDDFTGSAALGGDWVLEVATGSIETDNPFSRDVISNYAAIFPDGDKDNSFGSVGSVYTNFDNRLDAGHALVFQPDGKIIIAGNAFNSPNNSDFALLRYNYSGSLDLSFGNEGKVTTDFARGIDTGYGVALQPDGKIIIAGRARNTFSKYDFALARYQSNGSLDSSFGIGGKITTDLSGVDDIGNDILLLSDGKILVAGNANGDFALVRYNNNGSLDNSFGIGGKITTDIIGDDSASKLILQSDGKIVVVGSANGDFAIARYESNGSLDATFGIGGKVTTDIAGKNDSASSLVIQTDGKIVVAGTAALSDSIVSNDFALVRYNINGSIDNSFGISGKVITDMSSGEDNTAGIILQPDGKIIVGGSANNSNFALVRYNNDGSRDSSFGINGRVVNTAGVSNRLNDVILLPDGKILATGDFFVNGINDYDVYTVRYTNYFGINTPPVITLSPINISYTENAEPIIIDNTSTLTDPDSFEFGTGNLKITMKSGARIGDYLNIRNEGNGLEQINIDGRIINFGKQRIGTFKGGINGEALEITFGANNVSINAIQALLRNINYSNTSHNLLDTSSRTLEIILTDGKGVKSNTVTKNIIVNGVNDKPMIGNNIILYDGSLNTLPQAQGWSYSGSRGVTPTAINNVTNLNTIANNSLNASFSNINATLNNTTGYIVSFTAQILAELRALNANKNNDGKDDRAGFSLIVVSSDNKKAIELGFWTDRIWAQEDGTTQEFAYLEPADDIPRNDFRTLFTQGEFANYNTTSSLINYDLAVQGNTYTLFANSNAILSGRLRDYTAFDKIIPSPYQQSNLIRFGDNTTSARANINLAKVAVTTNTTFPSIIVNEDNYLAISNIFISDLDVETNNVNVSLSVTNGKLTINSGVTGGVLVNNISNNSTASVNLTGTIAEINKTLSTSNSLIYQNDLNFNGTDILTITVDDKTVAGTTTKNLNINVNPVNDAPTFTIGGNQSVKAGIGQQTISGWVSGFNPGAANELTQSVQRYHVEVINNSGILQGTPIITKTGDLIYTPINTITDSATATIRVKVQDDGGTLNSGIDTSEFQTFTITVNSKGINYINGTPLLDTLIGTDGVDRINGLDNSDIIHGGLGDDRIFGSNGDDTLYGDLEVIPAYGVNFSMNDTLAGGAGNDLIYGNRGNDKAYGDEGNDSIWGGDGDDEIWSGLGNDILNGGSGKDAFVIVRGHGVDTIEDFQIGEDVIGCAAGLKFDLLSFTQQGNNTLIVDKVRNQTLVVVNNIAAASFNSSHFRLF